MRGLHCPSRAQRGLPGILAAAATLLARTALAAGLTISANPRSVELGEGVTLKLSLDGARRHAQPQLKLPAGVRVAAGPSRSQTMRIVGGRATTTIEFVYTLAFDRAGPFTLGPGTVRTERGVVKSGTVAVAVRAAGKSRDVLVFASLEPSRAYVGQPVVATFEFAVAREVRSYSLNVPFLAELRGVRLSDPEDLAARWDESVRKTRRGIPGHGTLTVANAEVKAVARVSSREIEGAAYTVYTVRRVLLPQEPFRRDLGAARASASIIVGYKTSRDPIFDNPFFGNDPFPGGSLFSRRRAVTRTATAASKPLVLEVLPLPAEGRPADFSGAVGRYELAASAGPTKAVLGGEPVLLTLTVRGEGNLETVGQPVLADESAFRLGATEQKQDVRIDIRGDKARPVRLLGEKRFTIPLRPRRKGVVEIPPARLVVFDPFAEKYVTLATRAIPVTVTVPEGAGAVESLKLPDEARGGVAPGGGIASREEAVEDIDDIETEVDPAESHGAGLHRPWGFLVFFALPVAAYVGLFFAARRMKALRDDRTLARRLSAARTARAALDGLRSAGPELTAGEFAERLARVVQTYLADRLGRPAGEIPPEEAEALLGDAGFPDECAREAAAILREAEAARFGGGPSPPRRGSAPADLYPAARTGGGGGSQGGARDRDRHRDEWLRRAEALVEAVEREATR